MADPRFEPTSNSSYSPLGVWEPPAQTRVELRVTALGAARAEGHELAVQTLVEQLEDGVKFAGFSVTEASLLAEVLVEEESDHLFLVLTVAGFQRQDDRLDLWESLLDMVFENEDRWISERISLVIHGA